MSLHPAQAQAIAAAEDNYAAAKRVLEQAKRERDEVRAKYRDRFELGVAVRVGGVEIKVAEKSSGASFRLKAYLERHKLTKEMRPFVGEPTVYEDWRVKAL